MSEDDKPDEQREIKFKYIKSNFFRVIHADGAWGGISPRGNIHMSFYNERWAIPNSSRIVVGEDATVVKPEEFDRSGEVIRELEADVIVDLDTARRMHKWLGRKIEEFEALITEEEEKALNASEKTPSTK